MGKNKKVPPPCPCGSGKLYSNCCQSFHLQNTQAPTAESLMRARYCAYALKLNDYIDKTWHSSTRAQNINAEEIGVKWTKLNLKKAWQGSNNTEAFIEFEAHYKVNGKAEKMHEISRFIFEQNQWLYIDGQVTAD